MTTRIGVYSGTFDPVHAGHIAFALATLQTCELDKVVFLPEKQPRNKQNVTDLPHRLALLRTALVDTPNLDVIELSHPVFTVRQSLPELRALFGESELTLLIGSDVAQSIMDWPDIETLLAVTHIAIGVRAEDSDEQIRRRFSNTLSTVSLIHTDFSGLTSSRVRNGKADHATAAAAAYARRHTLYISRDSSYAL